MLLIINTQTWLGQNDSDSCLQNCPKLRLLLLKLDKQIGAKSSSKIERMCAPNFLLYAQ